MEIDSINELYNTEFTNKLAANKHIFYEIFEACGRTFNGYMGSYLFDGQTYKYCDKMYAKQELLFNSVKSSKKVLEIGTYVGHSLLIMLLANPDLKITCIDIDSRFTAPAVYVLNRYFNNAVTFIHRDSHTALKNITEKFDFFHIDGHHENNYINEEFSLVKNLNDGNFMKIIFDDQECLPQLQEDINSNYKVLKCVKPECLSNNVYYEIDLTPIDLD